MLEKIKYEDDCPVKVQVLKITSYPWHYHKDIQIIYVLEGEIELKITYGRYHLAKNQIHFIHSDDVHGIQSVSESNLVVLLSLNMDYFSKYYPHLDNQIFTTKVSENIATYKKQLILKAYIFSILSEFHLKERSYKERIKNTSHLLMDALYKDFRGFMINPDNRTFEHQISHDLVQIDRISRVVSYIYTNYPYKLSLAAIAEKENINSYYLSHLFQRFIGDSFRNFVSMVRIEMSEPELLSTNHSIAQISSNVGFSNAKYYVENFKYWFSCHPKEYRQLYKDKIISRAPIHIKELPLDSINYAIDSYEELPAFTGASEEVTSASFDFKKVSGFPRPAVNITNFADFYKDYDPQQDCIDFLKKLFKNPAKEPYLPSVFIDTESNRSGLLTLNNLKKPLYYLCEFLLKQFRTVNQYNDWYMITSKDEDIKILFFNEADEISRNMEFNIFNMPGKYQVTEHILSASSSCLDFWKQLEYKPDISDYEKQQIQNMSAPKISWKNISSSGSFTYSARLEPFDIVLAEIKKSGD